MTKRPRPRTANKTSAKRIAATVRAAQALRLRAQGETFATIAVKLHYRSRQAAHCAVTAALIATLQESSEEARTLDLERLDVLLSAVMPKAMAGNLAAVLAALRVLERRAKLLGLDAPAKVEANVNTTVSGGVLVVPGIVDEATWEEAAKKQQEALHQKELLVCKPDKAKAN